MKRGDGRKASEMRRVKITPQCNRFAEGSCLIEFGHTRVYCTASVEEGVPAFLKDSGEGWVTAEYGMLPRSCPTRVRRNLTSGRIQEISRLVGRSLRAVVDRSRLGERTFKIDCDVLQADGGTRTASITGGFVALALAVKKLRREGVLSRSPLKDYVAALSVGMKNGVVLVDLNYDEDASADLDMNVVMTSRGKFVEIQGTAEGEPFSKSQLDKLLLAAKKGIGSLISQQKKIVGPLS